MLLQTVCLCLLAGDESAPADAEQKETAVEEPEGEGGEGGEEGGEEETPKEQDAEVPAVD